jgi:glucose-1-phosphate thymidylyltransferase
MAGLGSRMRPHTWSRPKPLLFMAGKMVLDHALDQFKTLPGLEKAEYIFIVSPNQGDLIQKHMLAVHPEKKVTFVVQQVMQGQSHALLLAEQHLHGPALVAFSDTLIETDLGFLAGETADGVAWVKPVEDPRRFGVAEVNQRELAVRLIEKPTDCKNNLVLVGFYYFHEAAELISAIKEQIKLNTSLKGEFFLADAINIMLMRGARFKVRQTEIWLDAGIPEAVLETNRHFLDKGHGEKARSSPGVTLIQPVSIPKDVTLKNCVIGPHVTLGQRCVIENVVIRNSIVESDTSIHNRVIEDSLIGRHVIIDGKPDVLNIGDNSVLTN